MSVIRVKKNKNYTVMANYHLKDRSLSLKGKGLMSYMLMLPDDWEYSVNGLVSSLGVGKSTVVSALKELQVLGYLEIEKVQGKDGRFEYVYILYEKSKTRSWKPGTGNPGMEKPELDKPELENQTLLNTNILSTNKQSTNKQNTKRNSDIKSPTNLPSESYELAELLYQKVVENKPNRVIGKNWREKWAEEFDKLNRINGRSWEEIREVVEWCQSKECWWWDKIYSGEKIRKKIDDLECQMNREKGGGEKVKVYDFNEVIR